MRDAHGLRTEYDKVFIQQSNIINSMRMTKVVISEYDQYFQQVLYEVSFVNRHKYRIFNKGLMIQLLKLKLMIT